MRKRGVGPIISKSDSYTRFHRKSLEGLCDFGTGVGLTECRWYVHSNHKEDSRKSVSWMGGNREKKEKSEIRQFPVQSLKRCNNNADTLTVPPVEGEKLQNFSHSISLTLIDLHLCASIQTKKDRSVKNATNEDENMDLYTIGFPLKIPRTPKLPPGRKDWDLCQAST
jgi:hypothetical protein